jgi:hypothetical protein
VVNQSFSNQVSPTRILGTWTATADVAPSGPQPVSVTPASGAGSRQKFVVVSTDSAGATDLLRTYVIASSASSSASCYLVYVAGNGIYLLNDSATDFFGIVPGANSSIENSACRLYGSTSSVANSGTTQTLALDIYFKPAFAGVKTISVVNQTFANQVSATRQLGTWTVPQ